MTRLLVFTFILLNGWISPIFSQTMKQLQAELKQAKQDTARSRIILQIMDVETDKLVNEQYAKDVLEITGRQLKKGNLSKSEDRVVKQQRAQAYRNIGYLTKYNGDIKKALEYYHQALKLMEDINDKKAMGELYNNIGVILRQQKDFQTAITYFQKSYNLSKEAKKDEGMAYALNSLGALNVELKNYQEGIKNHWQSLEHCKKINDQSLTAMNYINIGYAYEKLDSIDQAIYFYKKSLIVSDSIQNKHSICYSLSFLGSAYLKQKQYIQAQKYLERSLQIAQELGFPENIKGTAERLYKTYEGMGDYKKAFSTYALYIQMRDSIYNQEIQTDILRKDLAYNYEKKAAADSIKAAEERKVVDAQFKKEQTQRYALYIGLALVLTFSSFLYNRFRVINRQKKIIEIKEQEAQEHNALIVHQKQIIEERHKEITDSINYAERIQRSFLASKELLNQYLPHYFIFFKPKDVVSGDFYWGAALKNGKFAFVTADSTGHGVPGAIMSLLNITSLEKAIESHVQPNEILDYTRTSIINRLKGDGSDEGGKDGMDCSVCVFDFKQLKLQVAAANNPVWIVRQGELIEILPDKMPVGRYYTQQTPFTQKEIQLQKGDLIYTMTDGFQDQFGGEKAKKFKTKNLRNLIISLSSLPIDEQCKQIEQSFNNWIGNLEQNDDVCLIGIQV